MSQTRTARLAPYRSLRVILLCVGLLGLMGLLGLVGWQQLGAAPALPGPVTACQGLPRFFAQLGIAGGTVANLSTLEPDLMGLVLVNPAAPSQRVSDPSWAAAGYLGPFVRDRAGNIITAPVPRVSIDTNPPEGATTLWRVASDTGLMQPWVRVPAPVAPTSAAPYGLVGLAYDCDTNSVYASSIAGSTRNQERGQVYRIDATTGAVTTIIDGLDVLGLGMVRQPDGTTRLYLGMARVPTVASVALDTAGDAVGDIRDELTLPLSAAGDLRARDIAFMSEGSMRLAAERFTYSLAAGSVQRITRFTYRYDAQGQRWVQDAYE